MPLMEHKGIPYTIVIGVDHGWIVSVRLPDGKVIKRTVSGTRMMAEKTARSLIDQWLKKQPVSETNPVDELRRTEKR